MNDKTPKKPHGRPQMEPTTMIRCPLSIKETMREIIRRYRYDGIAPDITPHEQNKG